MSWSCKIIGNTAALPLTRGESRDTIQSIKYALHGAKTRLYMKCKNCGATLDEGALFCRKCGTAAPKTPETETRSEKGTGVSVWKDRISGIFAGIKTRFTDAIAWIKGRFSDLKNAQFWKNRRLLMLTGAGAALLLVLIIVIASVASCKKTQKYRTPEALAAAVIEALNEGDGERLFKMAKLSENLLGVHTETFGGGETPEAVMKGYYERLAGDLNTRLTEQYGTEHRLEGQLETTIVADTSIFETNRALDLEAAQYAEISGPLTLNGESVTNVHIVAVELDGEWKLLVVYLY